MLGQTWDDPRTMATLQMAAGLLAAGGPSKDPVNLGQGLLGGLDRYSSVIDQAKKMKMAEDEAKARQQEHQLRLQEYQRKIAEQQTLQEAWQRNFKAGSAGGEPIGDTGDFTRPSGPSFDQLGFIRDVGGTNPDMAYKALTELMKPKTTKLGAGEVLLGGDNQVIASNPKEPDRTAVQKAVDNRDRYPVGSPMWNIFHNEVTKLTTRDPGVTVNLNEGQKGFENTTKLRTEYANLPTTKAHAELNTTADIIKTALKNPSPAADMAAATKFMKMLDPGSVVRESELAMAMNATGLMDRATNYAQMIIQGNKLTPAQRQDFYVVTQKIMDSASAKQAEIVDYYREMASANGLNPDHVVPRMLYPGAPMVGTVKYGYKYKGGNPAFEQSWEKVGQ